MSEVPPILELRKLAYGAINTYSLAAAAELGLADAIGDSSRTSIEIADELNLDQLSTFRLLRFLSSINVVEMDREQRFTLTKLGNLLRSDVPGSFSSMAQVMGSKYGATAYANIAHSIRTGESAFNSAHGMGVFEYVQPRERDRKLFYSAFTGISRSQAPIISQSFDFQQFDTIVDVGGGYGYLLLEILKMHDHPRGVVYDLPNVIQDAVPLIRKEGLGERCKAVEGDFFKGVPAGADAYILKLILHDWPDDKAVAILSNCREAMIDSGSVVVVEMVIPEEPDFGLTLAADMNMMRIAEGRERTRPEWDDIASRSGLKIEREIPTATGLSVLHLSTV